MLSDPLVKQLGFVNLMNQCSSREDGTLATKKQTLSGLVQYL